MDAIDLANALGKKLERALSPTLLWEHPTLEALIDHLLPAEAGSASNRPALERPRGPASEPAALVGIGCRFPGAASVAEFWELLCAGRDAVGEIPPERWDVDAHYHPDPAHPETVHTRRGAFLPRVDRFDPLFFKISPREAVQMDPQQRLMLELSWEALEDAGLPPGDLFGRRAGVFFGATWRDYADLHRDLRAPTTLHTGPGQALNIVANRVSYVFGLRGPSLVVDTACSSTLVALHLACRSLRDGESEVALVGGVNLMLSPATTVRIGKYGGLSADGRCKTFDRRADGFGRGEGAGVVILKPLSRALADGDRIYCVIRGSAVNNDGLSNGLTAPNPEAQQEVLRDAYRNARLAPEEVQVVEMHGAGTRLGDPIEARALSAVLCPDRPADRPLIVGAVKTNLAHLEAASGAAGLIKTALALFHRRIPPSLNCEEPDPELDLQALKLHLQQTLAPWPDVETARAGLSAFGWGGTNAHLVLEQAPSPDPIALLPLAAGDRAALEQRARALRGALQDGAAGSVADACLAASRRLDGERRLAVVGRTLDELAAGLGAFLDHRRHSNVEDSGVEDGCREHAPLAFVCGPLGAQWAGMGVDLLAHEPVFRRMVERCDRRYRELAGWSLLDEMARGEDGDRWQDMAFVPPLLFAYQVALAELWRSWGVVPDAVTGHSLGEVSAACIAGALSLDDALRIVSLYSSLLPPLAERSGLALCQLPANEVQRWIDLHDRAEELWIAGVDSAQTTLVAGRSAALDELLRRLEPADAFRSRLAIRLVAHCPEVEPVLDTFRDALADLVPRAATVPLVSSYTGGRVDGRELDAGHWARHLRAPVRFDRAVDALLQQGARTFLELGPHPVLQRALQFGVAAHPPARALASARRREPTRAALVEAAAALYVRGRQLDWPALLGSPAGQEPAGVRPRLIPLSAHAPAALEQLADAVAARLEGAPPIDLRDLAWTAALRRQHHPHRLALVAGSAAQVKRDLESWRAGHSVPRLLRSPAAGAAEEPSVAFVFSGQGPQWWWSMGRELLDREPAFTAALARCDAILRGEIDLLATIRTPPRASQLQRPSLAQPILVALQTALAALWRSWGIEPSVVLGHSFGEVAAAQVAGVLGLDDALRLAVLRGRAMEGAAIVAAGAGSGTMATVELPAAEAAELCRPYGERLVVASVNAPRTVVLAGEREAIDEVVADLERRGVGCWRLRAKLPYHSPRMEAASRELEAALGDLEPRPERCPIVSTVTGERASGRDFDAAYWRRNVRQPVRFAAAIDAAAGLGCDVFLEVSTQPLLADAIAQCLEPPHRPEREVTVLTTLAPGRESAALLEALAGLYVRGCKPHWQELHPEGGRVVSLPPYPFQRRRYWITDGLENPSGSVETAPAPPQPAIERRKAASPAKPTAPADATGDLRAIVGHVLHIAPDEVPVDTPFLSLGADSLILVEILRGIAGRFGVRLTVRQLFDELPTVGRVAAFLDGQTAERDRPVAPAAEEVSTDLEPPEVELPDGAPHALIERALDRQLRTFERLVERQNRLLERLATRPSERAVQPAVTSPSSPAPSAGPPFAGPPSAEPPSAEPPSVGPQLFATTEAQRELYDLAQISPAASAAYNESLILRLDGPLRPAALAAALQRVIERHEALRAVFPQRDVQVVAPLFEPGLPRVDLTAIAADRRDPVSLDVLRALAGEPFDLAARPPLRPLLLHLDHDRALLALFAHHLVLDGLSAGVVSREWMTLYRAATVGTTARLRPPLPFHRYAAWVEARRCAGAGRDEAYWRRELSQPPVFEPPTDRPRPPVRRFRGRQLRAALPSTAALAALGREHGASLFMTLLAVYTVLLHRLTGQDDLVVGVPAVHRPLDDDRPLVGHCVDLMPIRSRYRPRQTFVQHLRRIRGRLLEAQDHGSCSLTRLAQILELPHDPTRPPLVGTVLNLLEQPPLEVPGLTVSPRTPVVVETKFELALHLLRRDRELHTSLEGRLDLFDATTLERLLDAFGHLISSLGTAPPGTPLALLPLLAPAQRHQLLVEMDDTATAYPRQHSLAGLFADQVRQRGDAVAAVHGRRHLSYLQLATRSERLARRLRRLGAGPDRLVAIFLEPSAADLEATVAVTLAGAAYLPLDLDLPAERLAFMLDDSQAIAVLTRSSLVDRLPETRPAVVEVDGPSPIRALDPAPAGAPSPPETLAYAIYTSGSTGEPKAVAVPQRAVVRLVLATDYVDLRPGDAVGQAASTAFDAATFEIWGPLLNGGTVVGLDRRTALEPAGMAEAIARFRLRSLFLTTALFNQLVREAPGAFRPLRELLFGGEQVDAGRVRQGLQDGGPERLLHVYGPTESTTFALWHRVERVPTGQSVPIGLPLANTTARVVDRELEPVALGAPGELVLGGDGLARGYLARPALTATRFVPDPRLPGERLYRTGDRVRRLADGRVEFLGRFDFQIKLRGFRIELGEIESALLRHPRITAATVILDRGRAQDGSDARLLAYVVAAQDPAPEPRQLRRFLEASLPGYMVPAAIVRLEALPLNRNGKIDRAALPDPSPEPRPLTAPRTVTERRIAAAWCELLQLDRVDVEASFFDLGGNSLMAIRMISKLRDLFAVELTLPDVFAAPTVADLARRIAPEDPDPEPPLEPAARDRPLPLSFAQQRLWFLDRLLPGRSFYNMALAFDLAGELRPAALAAALDAIIERHEILRTTFAERDEPSADGEAVQVIHPFARQPLPIVDLGAVAGGGRTCGRLMLEEARRAFDLERGPLQRTLLLRLDGGRHRLLLTQHHAVSDGGSLAIFYRELATFYRLALGETSAALPRLRVQYADFALWQRRRFARRGHAQLAWWKKLLGPRPPRLELPTDRPRPRLKDFRAAERAFRWPAELADALVALARQQGATLAMAFQAAVCALLGRWSGQRRVVIGTPVSHRDRSELEPLIGFFVNSLALPVDLGDDPSYRDLLARLRDLALAAYEHRDLPFDRLVEELAPERDLSRHPLFDVMVAPQDAPLARLDLPAGDPGGLTIEPVATGVPSTRFDLELHLHRSADGALHGLCGYDARLFDAATVERLLEALQTLVAAAVGEPDRPLSALTVPVVSRARQLVEEEARRPVEEPSALTAPPTALERRLIAIWRQLLRVSEVTPDSDFFELGGHSLLAIRLVSRLRRELGVEVPVRTVFEAPTLAELARTLEGPAEVESDPQGENDSKTVWPPLRRGDQEGPLPLSFAQERLLFLDRLMPGSAFYNMPFALRLRGPLATAALESAFGEVVRRHAALRTTFGDFEGESVQRVRPFAGWTLPLVDLAELRDGELEARSLARADGERRFDLEAGPLLRTTLLRLGERDHVLLLAMHHIVSDGWSIGLLGAELRSLYRAALTGSVAELPPLPIQHADHAAWQRRLPEALIAGQVDWWKELLGEDLRPLELPTDRPRPAVQVFRGRLLPLRLPGLRRPLERLARRHDATLASVLLSVFFTLLHRLTGHRRPVVGMPVAGRLVPEVENLIGFFVNTLPMPADLRPAAGPLTFSQLLRQVQQTALGAFAHQDLPFERLIAELGLERDLSRNPLFQVMFALQNAADGAWELDRLEVEALASGFQSTRFDLELHGYPSAEDIEGFCTYDADLFDATTVRRLIASFRRLCIRFVEDPDLRLADVPYLGDAEQHQLQHEWNLGHDLPLEHPDLYTAFLARARRQPDAVALVDGDHRLAYRALARRAGRLAASLRRRGVETETLVALSFERGAEMVVAILGTLAAGGAYVPLDPATPETRREAILADAKPALTLDEDRLRSWLGQAVEGTEMAEGTVGRAPVRPENLAYVIFTSGSTGRPKGVAVSHRNVLRLIAAARRPLGLGGDDVWTLFHSYAFDVSVWEIWGALSLGGRLVVVPYWVSRSPQDFRRLLIDERVTVLSQTPSAFRQLQQADLERPGRALDRLRRVVFGGEALDQRGLAPWFERYNDERPDDEGPEDKGPRLINMYGITETTVHTTVRRVRAADARSSSGRSTIGSALADLSLQLLDPRGHPVAIGVAGEIHVGGPGVARGYLGRPALTAERFVPGVGGAGRRLYRSGDLARYRGDGDLEYLGRLDFQVQIRGFRVELGEIEAALVARPEIGRALVLDLDQRLVAFVVAESLDAVALRRELRDELPDYMIPAAIVRLDELPLNANGKIDRAALRALAASSREETAAAAAPRTPEEERVIEIYRELLQRRDLGVDDAFFDLGGDSISATRAIARIRAVLGVEVPLRQFFAGSSAAQVAATVRRLSGGTVEEPIRPRDGDRAPLSYAQRRLWFLDRLYIGDRQSESALGDPAYNMPLPLRLSGPLSPPALAAAFARLRARHEVLRTRFPHRAGDPYQQIDPAAPAFPLPVLDLEGLSADDRSRRLDAELRRLLRQPFDLARGPLIRARLLRLTAGEHVLLLSLHHIVADGWSLGVLLREIALLHEALSAGRPEPPLPELPVQYADYARWQQERMASAGGRAQLAWWKERLAPPRPVLDLPGDRPRPRVDSHRGERLSATLDPELSARVRDLGRRHGATLFMTLLAALEIVLARLTGERDVLVGTPIAGRRQREVEGLIGCFLNTLVLRTDLSPVGGVEPTFLEVLARIRDTALDAYAHQETPFELLLEELAPERDLSRTPFFQVFFNLLNFPLDQVAAGGLRFEPLDLPEVQAKFDLTVYASDDDAGICWHLVYRPDLFDRARMEALSQQLEAVLRQAVDRRGQTLPFTHLSLATPAPPGARDFSEVVSEADAPSFVAVHDLFLRHAERRPHRVALVDRHATWTYAQLAASVAALAHRLIAGGVERGAVVAVVAERRAELAAVVLGVLRAGAAFTLLDPKLPAARRDELLRLSGARNVIEMPDPASLELLLPPEAPPDATPLPPFELQRDDLAAVTFTSGSTGVPKGVLGRHGPLSHFLPWQAARFELDDERTSVASGLAHDPLQRDLFTPLCLGGTAVFPLEERLEPGYLAAWMTEQRITLSHLTPALAQVLGDGAATPIRTLRRIFLVGDALTRATVERLRRLAPRAVVVNLYGSTETQRAVAFHVAGRGGHDVLPLGHGMAGVELLVLNRAGEPCGVGELGEIHLASAHLARGYLDDPALTAERFLPAPGGGRRYRTGDLGRLLPDGEVSFAGRADRQLKIRGFRVEPGEIEARLLEHPAVQAACVIAWRDQLVAFVAGEQIDGTALLEALRQRLPAALVPASVTVLAALPLTANAKVDRAALLALRDAEQSALPGTWRPPATATERRLARIWRDVLGVERAGRDDSFFALGGHSLLATRLVARMTRELGRPVSLRTLFERPILAALAAVIDAGSGSAVGALGSGEAGSAVVEPAEPRPDAWHEPFPLTDIQQAYWVGRQAGLELGGVASHRYLEVDLHRFDLERAVRVWRFLVERHGMLRAIVLADGRQQILARVPAYRPEILDLRRLGAEHQDRALGDLRRAFSHEVFDLERWPLFAFRAVRLSEDRIRLLISLDFLIVDATGFRALAAEAVRLYLQPEAAHALPPIRFSFRDYVLAFEELRRGTSYRRSLEVWRRRAETLPGGPELALERDPSSLEKPRFERHGFVLEPDAWTRLQERGSEVGLTPSGLLLTAFASVLATWSTSRRFSLVLTLFNTLPFHPDVELLVGDFTSTTLLVVDPRPGESFTQRARRLQERLWSDLDHRQVSAVEVVRELARGGGRGRALSPIVFTSTLGLDAGPALEIPPDAPEADLVFSLSQTPQVLLDHQVSELDGRLHLNWDVVAEAFPRGMIEAMLGAYRQLLQDLARDRAAWSATARCLTPARQLEARARVNATAVIRPAETLHQPFFERARRDPGRPAVVLGDRTLTYGELLHRSRRLARRLRAFGTRPGELVAVMMEKSWQQVVAVLGILEAGSAYLPIAPDLPVERRNTLLRSGRVRLALVRAPMAERPDPDWPDSVGRWPVDGEGASVPERDAGRGLIPPVPADELAYVIFTSGSTGVPKGVMIEHRAARNTLADLAERFALGPDDRVLALSSLSFDLSVFDLFGTLAAGGAVVLPGAAERDPAAWLAALERGGVTVWNSVPALMEILVEHLETAGATLPASLRLVLLSGDWIPVDLPRRIRRRASAAIEIVSLGGATEASIWSNLFVVGEVEASWRSIPYGRPLENQRFHVLDRALQPRPIGVPGELFIAGDGLARGYWRDPRRTAESFIPGSDGERLYATGDLGRYLGDGQTLEFLGRRDFQVKVAGYRIELGDIEAALLAHPRVRAAVVVARGDRHRRSLVAYPVLDVPVPDEELRRFLQDRLPAYMVPAVFVPLDRLPLTANGKVDRTALPEPHAVPCGDPPAAPSGPLASRIAELFAAVLELDEAISPEADFFALGGNSVDAIRLITRLRQRLEVALDLGTFFDHPTVAGLARHLDAETDDRTWTPLVRLGDGDGGPPIFCVHPVGGTVRCYSALARRLETAFYGLQAQGLVAGQQPLETVEELAAHHLAALREHQSEGPYRLAGWSMGGLIAWEIARQLVEAGEAVETLMLLDAGPSQIDRLRREEPLLARLRLAAEAEPLPAADLERARAVLAAHDRAMRAYRPRHADLPLILFTAGDRRPHELDDPADLGWSALGVEPRVVEVPGNHLTLIEEPQVAELARRMRELLALRRRVCS